MSDNEYEVLAEKLRELNRKAKLCHNPAIWNFIPDEEKRVILKKEETLKVAMATLFNLEVISNV